MMTGLLLLGVCLIGMGLGMAMGFYCGWTGCADARDMTQAFNDGIDAEWEGYDRDSYSNKNPVIFAQFQKGWDYAHRNVKDL